MRRGGPETLAAMRKYADEIGNQPDSKHFPPALQWEAEVYEWHLRLQAHVLTRSEAQAAGMGGMVLQVPCALDRTAWWPLIDKQRWSHEVVMSLLDAIDFARFESMPTQDEQADDE